MLEARKLGHGRGGVFWQTQGSGKSLTMAMLALGMGIQWQALRCAGIRPLWLAGALWLWLLGAGAVLTRWGWPG